MGVRHALQISGPSDPALPVDLTDWNADHVISDYLDYPAIATPAAPPADTLRLFARKLAGRVLLAQEGPSGIDTTLQPSLHGNAVFSVSPSNGTAAPSVIGGTLTTAGTLSYQFSPSSTSRALATARKRFQTAATAGSAAGMRQAYQQWFRGSEAGFGGFFFRSQFGQQLNLNGGQFFIGLAENINALAGDPSTSFNINMCGMGYDAADLNTGNWFFFRNDVSGAPVKVNLGATAPRNTTNFYDLAMFMAPGGSDLAVQITNLSTNVVVLDTVYNTEVPAANTGLAFHAEVRNGALASAANIEVAKAYIESDY